MQLLTVHLSPVASYLLLLVQQAVDIRHCFVTVPTWICKETGAQGVVGARRRGGNNRKGVWRHTLSVLEPGLKETSTCVFVSFGALVCHINVLITYFH
jgi:hypothetical protein